MVFPYKVLIIIVLARNKRDAGEFRENGNSQMSREFSPIVQMERIYH